MANAGIETKIFHCFVLWYFVTSSSEMKNDV